MARRKAFLYGTGVLVFLILGLGLVIHAKDTSPGPSMMVNERAFDFKEVKEGSTVEHAFHVSNKGDQVLEIRTVKTS